MAEHLDSYNEIGWVRPLMNKYRRIGFDPRYLWYRLNWRLVAKRHYITRFPIHVDIETTNHCNLKCTMCPHSLAHFQMEKGYFDFELFKSLLPQFQRFRLSSLKLNIRGEPLLHQNLADMVRLAKSHRVLEVMFNTNGLLLTPETSRELIDTGLDYLIVSIDGATAATYEKVRKGGSFSKLLDNLHFFIDHRRRQKLRKPLLRLQFVEMQENAHEVEHYLAAWRDKADVLTVNRYSDRGCGERQVFDMVPAGRANCPHPWRRLSITWQGDVLMCCGDWENRCVLGNVREKSLHEIWHGPLMNVYRQKLLARRLDEIPCCRDCFVLASYIWERKSA